MQLFFRSLLLLLLALSAVLAQNPAANCPIYNGHIPKDINDVRPENIELVMALGDSISAGFGVMGRDPLYQVLDEWRGKVAWVGGDENATAMGTIFQHFNPNVKGYSLGHHLVELPGWSYHPELDQLNAAQSNAVSGNLPAQVNYLVSEIKKNNWNITGFKHLNIIIGANDACGVCSHDNHPPVASLITEYRANLEKTLTMVHELLPNTFISLLPMFNVSQVYNLGENVTYCHDFHDIIPIECPCAWSHNVSMRTFLDEAETAFAEVCIEVAKEWQAKNLTDFAVIIQPFSQFIKIPSESYCSTVDCFHPALIAHEGLAIATWNSLITPAAQKPITFNPATTTLKCPGPDDRLYTN